jgi:hypothetical protein
LYLAKKKVGTASQKANGMSQGYRGNKYHRVKYADLSKPNTVVRDLRTGTQGFAAMDGLGKSHSRRSIN